MHSVSMNAPIIGIEVVTMQRDAEKSLPNGDSYPEINMSRIRVGGGIAGLIFAAGTVYIFVVGVPAIRGFFIWSLIAGALISICLHLVHKCRPARPAGGNLDLLAEVDPRRPIAKGESRFHLFVPSQPGAASIG